MTQPDAFDASTWTLKEETPAEPTESMPTLFSEPIAPTAPIAPIAPIAWNASLNPEPPQEEATVRFNLPMDEEEAIEQMELLGHDFFVFFSAEEEAINVLYRRRDGNYGLLQPDMD